MKKLLLPVLFLALISAVSGLSVGYVNSLTKPIIEERLLAAEKENLARMYPNGEFAPVEKKDDEGIVDGIYEVKGQGYAVKLHALGYNTAKPIIVLVGFDQKGTITDFICLEQQETDGFGARVFEEENIQKLFIGKDLNTAPDLLTGATVTSTALQKALTHAQAMIRELV